MHNLSSQQLRSLIALTQKKENLLAQLDEVNEALVAAISPIKPAASAAPAKKSVKKPVVKKATKAKKNLEAMKSQLLDILQGSCDADLTNPQMDAILKLPDIVVGAPKLNSKKPSKKTAKSANRGPKPGGKPGGTKARILALLATAGSKGLTVKEVAEKLNLSRAGVSVWFGKTGKNLTTRLSPGCYALKG